MKTTITLFLATALLSLAGCTDSNEQKTVLQDSASHNAATEAKEEVKLPAFKVTDVNGTTLDLSSLKGKKVFVNLWASWCPPCRREMPSIEKLYQSVDKNKAAFILLALDDNFEKSINYIRSKKLDLPIYYPAENLPALFNVPGIPATFIFNEEGQLIQVVEGSDNYHTDRYKKLLGS